MPPSSQEAVLAWLKDKKFTTVLDAPSGDGWLVKGLKAQGHGEEFDGIDLYEAAAEGYRRVWKHDLNEGLPADCSTYDLVCCCEGIEHVGNPLLLFQAFKRCITPGGHLVVTTPNVWYPQARLQYLARGFFPSFPCLAGKIVYGSHMHIMPWNWPQLYLYLKLAGFDQIQIVSEPLSVAKHLHEKILSLPALLYARRRVRKARTDEERGFWETAGSDMAVRGRHLIVTARPT
ncbi:class I SAM-dependent methyltransferase [Prosthecobacter sp.]|uniref:class I SAM-dependent methyltransferase n=1 Tax=Prosthecobacter sp. TaxID=1965333 RepID=UPI002ABA2541|nr:class I SAM-dependent methyltransferase [Prosthecobacter sp.]MDZ4401629.1 class I SAM-dependent methyltransferase [Prosthecobacter sp.]